MSAYAPLIRKSDGVNSTKSLRKPASRLARRRVTWTASPGRLAGKSEAETLPSVTQHLHTALSGGGEPLTPAVLRFMEPRFGSRFDNVRVHHDERAHALNQALNARAFTLGADVFFERGQFEPQTSRGQRLLSDGR